MNPRVGSGDRLFACAITLACLTAQPAGAQTVMPAVEEPPFERYVLGNGLTVVLQHDPRQPTIAGVVAYRVGARDDPPGYRGLAHLVEHLTFRGSRHLADGASFAALEAVGARRNAFTAPDFTAYIAEFPARHLPRFLWIESERMAFTLEAMNEERFEIEQKVVLNEMLQRRNPGTAIREAIHQTTYPELHVYRQIADRDHDVERLELDHARWFFQRHYRPDNAMLVLVGNLEHTSARALIERYFGPLRAVGKRPGRVAAPAISFGGSQRMTFSAPLPHSELQVRWSVPCREVRCAAQLDLLRVLLTGHGSALAAYTKESTRAADMSIGFLENHAEVRIAAQLGSDADVQRVLGLIDRELATLAAGKADELTLRMAKLAFATTQLYAQESQLARAIAFAVEPERSAPARVKAALALGVQDMAEAARTLLPRDRRLVVVIERADRADFQGELDDSDGELRPQSSELQR